MNQLHTLKLNFSESPDSSETETQRETMFLLLVLSRQS